MPWGRGVGVVPGEALVSDGKGLSVGRGLSCGFCGEEQEGWWSRLGIGYS